jgi:hypothetical protein
MKNFRYTDEQMVAELRRVAGVNGVLSRPAYQRAGTISAAAISVRFGGWLAALERAEVRSPYKYGGLWFSCPICGTSFRSTNSSKARKTCSMACTSELQSRTHITDGPITKQGARGRASRLKKGMPCERCGHDGTGHRLERHHKDRDPFNNAPENVEVLCKPCHLKEHEPERRRPTGSHLVTKIND